MDSIDKLFEGMAKAEIFGRGNFMEAGLYTVETTNIFVKDGFRGKSFIAEFKILTSNNPNHAPGTSGSWVLKFEWPATYGHITKFVMALLGYDLTAKNQADPKIRKQCELVARAVCGSETAQKELGKEYEDGMLIGLQLGLECTVQKTAPKIGKPQGGDFTSFAWSPIKL